MRTTLNVGTDILQQISRAAQAEGIRRSEMMVILIKKVMIDIKNPECIGKLIRYQARREPEEWEISHLSLRWDDYEYFQDMRKLLKMSVSFILAYAVKKFLGKTKTLLKRDNYPFNYVIVKETIDNIICWRFFWGFPPGLQKIL